MRYLITGAGGALGSDLVKELERRGEEVLGTTHQSMDISNREQVYETIFSYKPDVIIHAAAYTKVDNAEKDSLSAYAINAAGTRNIVDASNEIGAKVIYVSTDYVFDGKKENNELYEVSDQTNPLSIYGKTKLLGEEFTKLNDKHFIVRTSWVFGSNGNNFVKTMLKLGEKHDTLSVVNDQIGSPTYTVDLANLLIDMSKTDKYGTYQASNYGYISWAEFAKKIFETFEMDVKVNEVSTIEYQNISKTVGAPRPNNSRFSFKALEENGFNKLPDYEDALKRYRKELTETKKLILK